MNHPAHALLLLTFALGAIPANLLALQYGLMSRWRLTMTGRVMLALFVLTAISYDLSLAVLLWPDLFVGPAFYLRIGIRGVVALALWALYGVLVWAQRRTVRRSRAAPTPPDGIPPLEEVGAMFTALFWKATVERALKTAAQVLLVYLGADLVDAFAVHWDRAAGIAAGAAFVSVLTSLASSQIGEPKGSPSLVGEEV